MVNINRNLVTGFLLCYMEFNRFAGHTFLYHLSYVDAFCQLAHIKMNECICC